MFRSSRKPTVTRDSIAEGLRGLGVQPGASLLVHSSLSRFGSVDGGEDAVCDALLQAVGPDGTVLLPTHTWSSVGAGNPLFNRDTDPCCVGKIPETFRHCPEVTRGFHPTHSCAGAGPRTDEFLVEHELDVTPCGARSPYQRLIRAGGFIVLLGVNLEVNTSYHALEEIAACPWLFDNYEMLYTVTPDGKQPVPSLRHAANMPRAFESTAPLLREAGVMREGTIGAATVRVLDAAAMARVLVPKMAQDRYLLLTPEAARRERGLFERTVEARRG